MSRRACLPWLLVLAAACGDDLAVPVDADARGESFAAAPQGVPAETPPPAPHTSPAPAAPPVDPTPAAPDPAAAAAATEPPPARAASDVAIGDPTGPAELVPPPPAETPAPAAEEPVAAAAPDVKPGAAAQTHPKPKAPELVDGVWHTSFLYLGDFDPGVDALASDSTLAQHTASTTKPVDHERGARGIPDAVRALDGKKVTIEGFMIPLRFEKGRVRTFFLSRYMMSCCFGLVPKANEVISVEMTGDAGAYYDAYMPFVVTGTLSIVEAEENPEFLRSIFRLQADSCVFADEE